MYDLKIVSYIAATLACLALLYAARTPKRTGVFFAGGTLWTSSPKDALEQAAGILNAQSTGSFSVNLFQKSALVIFMLPKRISV